MNISTVSSPFTAALDRPSRASHYSPDAAARGTRPGSLSGLPGASEIEAGFVFLLGGATQGEVPNRLVIKPICGGPPGSRFGLRLHGVRPWGNDPNTMVWDTSPIVELACVAGDCPGPKVPEGGGLPQRLMAPTDNFCDSVTPVAGTLGLGASAGYVGGFGPGSGYGAFVVVDIFGSPVIHFDFRGDGILPMNALWARA